MHIAKIVSLGLNSCSYKIRCILVFSLGHFVAVLRKWPGYSLNWVVILLYNHVEKHLEKVIGLIYLLYPFNGIYLILVSEICFVCVALYTFRP